jgi:glycerol-3-phosphate dehydrogenase
VCGCSLLYALARYRVTAMLLEKNNDEGTGATKANSAIVHAGYDPEPGTLMARCNVEGNALIRELAARLDILYRRVGSLVVGFDEADRAMLDTLLRRGRQNGVPGLELIQGQRLRAMEPGLNEEARWALYAPTAGVVNPWELACAQAEVAVKNGANVLLDAEVRGIERAGEHFILQTQRGPVEARYVVNCAGAAAAEVAALAGPAGFSIRTSRGQYYLLDKSEGEAVRQVVFQCPTPLGKGVLVAPTVHGNLIIGPSAEPATGTSTSA